VADAADRHLCNSIAAIKPFMLACCNRRLGSQGCPPSQPLSRAASRVTHRGPDL